MAPTSVTTTPRNIIAPNVVKAPTRYTALSMLRSATAARFNPMS